MAIGGMVAVWGYCVVCGYHRNASPVLSVTFAEYDPYCEKHPYIGASMSSL